jgi:hypothetical protein
MRHMSGYWGSFKSVTYSACPPLTPAIHGTVTAHPICPRHDPGTEEIVDLPVIPSERQTIQLAAAICIAYHGLPSGDVPNTCDQLKLGDVTW